MARPPLIVVGVDGSQCRHDALRYGAHDPLLARRLIASSPVKVAIVLLDMGAPQRK
ncbi:MAG: hypothetical protein ACXVFO_21565 [Solirubrobacteraceae bacterium]